MTHSRLPERLSQMAEFRRWQRHAEAVTAMLSAGSPENHDDTARTLAAPSVNVKTAIRPPQDAIPEAHR